MNHPTRRTLGVTAGALTLALALSVAASGCSFGSPSPDKTAATLATGLSKGDVAGVRFTDAAAAKQGYDQALAPMQGIHAKVTVGTVDTHGDDATARLHWSWDMGAKTWTYETTARLAKSGDQWRVRWSPTLVNPRLTGSNRLATVTVNAARGDILGAHDAKLVTDWPVYRIGVDKSKVSPATALTAARAIAGIVGIDPAPYVKQVRAAGAKQFVEAIVLRRSDAGNGMLVRISRVPGGLALADQLPLAPTRDFAAALLGRVGPATAEIVKKSNGLVKAGDDVGLSGLEQRYDDRLAGVKGIKVDVVDGSRRVATLFSSDPVAGKPLHTTLDERLQRLAESDLAGIGPASALVAIRPSTGAVLAAASGPGSNGYNTATYGQYAPGSTFKIVSALALLRAGLTPSSTVHCTPTVDVDGKVFKNYSDYPASGVGDISLADAFANSCNTAFIRTRTKLSADALQKAAASLGLGVDHDVGFPAYFGNVQPASGDTEAAADMIGQGKDLASPLAMATVVASVVHGRAVLPRLVLDAAQPTVSTTPLTGKEQSQLRALMRGVVTHGSGTLLADLPGPPALAKTGTAEYGTKPPLPTHAWMVAAHGDLAVAVFVATGATGSHTAGPILKRFLQQAG